MSGQRENEEKKQTVTDLLTTMQRAAFDALQKRAAEQSNAARKKLIQSAVKQKLSENDVETCLSYLRESVPLIIHVPLSTCIEALLNDTHYRSLFETTSKNHGERAERQRCENKMFAGHYDKATDAERVKYGTIALREEHELLQGSPAHHEYGTSYFVLRDETVRDRVSISDTDTIDPLAKMGTLQHCAHVVGSANVLRLLARQVCKRSTSTQAADCAEDEEEEEEEAGHELECQYHGDIVLNRDIACLVVSKEDATAVTDTGKSVSALARQFAEKNGCKMAWASYEPALAAQVPPTPSDCCVVL